MRTKDENYLSCGQTLRKSWFQQGQLVSPLWKQLRVQELELWALSLPLPVTNVCLWGNVSLYQPSTVKEWGGGVKQTQASEIW